MTTGPRDELTAVTAGLGHLRASDADREQVIDALKTAFVQGRLAKGELDERVGQALASRTYADLAAVTADLPASLDRAQPPRKPARATARPPGTTDIKPGVVAGIMGLTLLTAALWMVVLIGHKLGGDSANAKGMLLSLFVLTPTDIGMLTLTGAVIRESRQQRRSRAQRPPSPPRAGGRASQRLDSGASAEPLPQVKPGQQQAAETHRSRLPDCSYPARGRCVGTVLGAV